MAGSTASRLGKKRAPLEEASLKAELKRKKKDDKKPVSDEENNEEKPDAAPPVNLIRFLPEKFLVDRLLPSKLDFDTPDETPAWKPCAIPIMKAGMTRSMGASMTKGHVLSSNAFQEVYLRPRFAAKKNDLWYDFADNGGRLIAKSLIYLDPRHREDKFNNEKALELLELHLSELESAVKTFGEKQTKWRCDRRTWEFDFIKWLYAKHPNTLVNEDKINDDDITELEAFVKEENHKDENGEYEPWFMGRLDDYGQVVVQHKDRDSVASKTIPEQIKKTKTAITTLKAHLQGKTITADDDDDVLLLDGESDKEDKPMENDDEFPIPTKLSHYVNWTVERHDSWTKADHRPKTNRAQTYMERYYIGNIDDLQQQEWPDGSTQLNVGLYEMKAPEEDLDKFPWGKPAHKLYDAVKKTDHYDSNTLYTANARKMLILIEDWYFRQDERLRTSLADKDLKDWNMSRAVENALRDFITSLME